MGLNIKDQSRSKAIERNLANAQKEYDNSLEKLSSGKVFTSSDPRPSERSLSDSLEFKLRGLASSKRNINDAVNLIQTADSGLSELSNIVLRMKEITAAGQNSSISDKERGYLFIEYEALFNEVNRISQTTEFNGIPLLNGNDDRSPADLQFRIGNNSSTQAQDEELNIVKLIGFQDIVTTSVGLGLKSITDTLSGTNGEVTIDDIQDLLIPDGDGDGNTSFDQALNLLNSAKVVYGAMQSRLQHATDFVDVYQENISAAKSNISDTNYATEVSKMVQGKLRLKTVTSVLAQGNINAQLASQLLSKI